MAILDVIAQKEEQLDTMAGGEVGNETDLTRVAQGCMAMDLAGSRLKVSSHEIPCASLTMSQRLEKLPLAFVLAHSVDLSSAKADMAQAC